MCYSATTVSQFQTPPARNNTLAHAVEKAQKHTEALLKGLSRAAHFDGSIPQTSKFTDHILSRCYKLRSQTSHY